jgi:hypothetical protein
MDIQLNIPHKITSLLLIALSIILYSCNTTEPDGKTGLNLSLEDISCTEAWIRLAASGISSQSKIEIKVDDKLVRQLSIAGTSIDSIVYIDSLLPGREYMFSASIVSQPFLSPKKTEVSARTLDTTSHDFTWETFTFGGDAGSCLLSDIAVINGNDIWAVGEIYLDGETDAYNAVHWDGKKWELKRIPIRDYGGAYYYVQISTVFAFSEDNVWFASNADLIQWDGNNFTSRAFFMLSVPFTGQVRQMWGKNSKNIYCAGNGGALYNYTGSGWKKIESGTEQLIVDIWGNTGTSNTKTEILYVAEDMLFRINNNLSEEFLHFPGYLSSAWFVNTYKIYAAGLGIKLYTDNNWATIDQYKNISVRMVRGNGNNDVMFTCSGGEFIHFNGYSWQYYGGTPGCVYMSSSIKDNTAAACGWYGSRAVITIGRRN